MGKIVKLPQEVRVKIAAGEVVESPLSVVKELVENSIDAGARKIEVYWEEGGLKSIKVKDDGCGIEKEDLPLTVERYATSKIRRAEDLFNISSLGFRGEALASIAAVSRMSIISRAEGKSAFRIEVEGGKALDLQEDAHPPGTTVHVRDLFFNFPARRKFMKSPAYYNRVIIRFLNYFCIAFPEIHFQGVSNGKEVINYPAVSDLGKRIYQVFGKLFFSDLEYVESENNGRQLYGFISKPFRGRSRPVHAFYVNRRLVQNKEILFAFEKAFEGRMEKGKRPSGILFFQLPPEEVDVNVHPTKREVKFRDKESIFSLVKAAVGGLERVREASGGAEVKEIKVDYTRDKAKVVGEAYSRKKQAWAAAEALLSPPSQRRVLGQIKNLYIVVEDEDGLLVVDQHNAHERIIFERIKKKIPPPAPLLIPLIVDLTADQLEILRDREEKFRKAGFEVEFYSGRSVAIKSIPSILGKEEAVEAFFEILEEGELNMERLFATLACKAAVKKGETLPLEKMQYIVDELFKTENPSLCPHGRPIVLKLTWEKIDKAMGRSGHEKG